MEPPPPLVEPPPVEPDPPGPGGSMPPPAEPKRERSAWWRASFHAGVSPRGLAVGDFNGDGAVDVAVNASGRNFTSQYVSRVGEFLLLLNDGRGGLGKVTALRDVRGAMGRIAAGDADGDGDLDVLVGTRGGAQLLLGEGNGSFAVKPFSFGEGVVSSLGFWSGGAGSPFLWVLGNEASDEGPGSLAGFSLLRPRGDGGFEASFLQWEDGGDVVYMLDSGLEAAVADYNEDGFADVAFNATLEHGHNAHLFLGDAMGRVRAAGLALWSGFVRHLYTTDFNRDGHADLLAATATRASVFLGDGQGGFSLASTVFLEPDATDVAVVHLDTDGLPDVVALHGTGGAVTLLRGKGDGTLVSRGQLSVGRAPSAAATADLDGDGTPELLVAEADDNTVSVYAIPDELVREPLVPFACPLASRPGGSSTLPSVSPLATVETGVVSTDVAMGDFDADGRQDVALALPEKGVRLVLNAGNGTFMTRDVASHREARGIVAGDFDGDGRTDLAGAFRRLDAPPDTWYGPSVGVLWNDTTAPFERELPLWALEYVGYHLAADFNRDGRMDLVVAVPGYCLGTVLRFTNQGDGTFRGARLEDYNPEPDDSCAGVGAPLAADFNGDGTLDLIHTTLGINLNPTAADGSTLRGHGFAYQFSAEELLGVTDADGDGRMDLVQAASRNGGVVLYPGDGHGSLGAAFPCAPPVGDKTLALTDLDADGVSDFVGVSQDNTTLWVALGTGGGNWGRARRYEPGGQVEWVRPVNLLGDARPELAVMLRSGRLVVFPTPES
ncbi:FG-GAP repeat domain-containing protein [Archangium lipolyticum]|uniref:FG-GAP repeat domain-containing protein n=1 Tax=Archangium lipolyticum TaxID=2970465 RepID=UPI002149DAA0|nr:VCBS repeat-containing protein [Archangium lipolyticum]